MQKEINDNASRTDEIKSLYLKDLDGYTVYLNSVKDDASQLPNDEIMPLENPLSTMGDVKIDDFNLLDDD